MAKEKKPKKELTTKQKQNKYRALQYTAIGGMFGSILTPFIVLGIVNYEDWFKTSEGWKVGLGGTLALAVVGFAFFLVTRKKEKESKVTDGWITLIVMWFAIAFIFKLLSSIYYDIFTIMMWTGLGLAGAFGLDIVSKKEKEKADAYKEARKKAKQESIEEKAKREVDEELKKEESRPYEQKTETDKVGGLLWIITKNNE